MRLTTTHFLGHLMGCLEIAEFLMYASASTAFLAQYLCALSQSNNETDIYLYSLLIYGISCIIIIAGNKFIWPVMRIFGLASLVITIIYILGSLPWVNFKENASNGLPWFNGAKLFMKGIPAVLWFYIGVEAINNATYDAVEPKVSVPRGYVSCISTLIITAIGVLFVSVSLEPISDVSQQDAPLSYGFNKMFAGASNISVYLSLPSMFATVFGFIYAYTKRIKSLGRSSLIPSFLGKSILRQESGDVAVICGSIVSMGCLVVFQEISSIDGFIVCVLCSCLTYCLTFVSYMIFCIQFNQFSREFKSPFGLIGAIVGFVIFLLVFLGCAAFQDSVSSLICFLIFLAVILSYYFIVVKHQQFFSEEEQSVLLPFYTAKRNIWFLFRVFYNSNDKYHLSSLNQFLIL